MKRKLFENVGGNMFKLGEDEHDRIDPDQKWDKVPQHPPADQNPEESREVQIGKEIYKTVEEARLDYSQNKSCLDKISNLAQEPIQMHGQK